MTGLSGYGYLIGGGAVLLIWMFSIFKAVLFGGSRERAKQDKARLEAAEDRLEMHREATDAERRAAGMTDDEARAEAAKWVKR